MEYSDIEMLKLELDLRRDILEYRKKGEYMGIKIIKTEFEGTSGDCISHYKAKFEKNPTLGEFVDWILTNRKGEWGYIGKRALCIEYRCGKITCNHEQFEEHKNKKIRLLRMDGGWSRMDYTIEFV